MEINYIHSDAERASYPFGEFMSENIPLINKTIDAFLKIEAFKEKPINFICMGSSGAIVATLFSVRIPNSKIIHIKKEGESSHHNNCNLSETDFKGYMNVIVDDFICSGSTLNRIYNEINDVCKTIHCVCHTGLPRAAKLNFTPKYYVSL